MMLCLENVYLKSKCMLLCNPTLTLKLHNAETSYREAEWL